jgi:type IV pilus assembly protein PilA
MTVVDRAQLEAAIGKNAGYYLRRFEKIDSGRKAGWNWPAFFLSTAWFSYRNLDGWAALNFIAALAFVVSPFFHAGSPILGLLMLFAYPVVFFILAPLYADVLYYRSLRKKIARESAPPSRQSSPTRPFSASIAGLVSILIPGLLFVVAQGAYVDYTPRSQVSEAISLMGGAKTSIAEYRADKGKWPADLKEVAQNTSGRYTERIGITAGAGAASGPLTMTATMKTDGVRAAVAGKTVQMSSEDEGKTWTCTRGAVNGVDNKYLPAACR